MRTHDIIFANRPYLLAANIVSYNASDIAFSPYGDYWRQLRKICVLEMLSSRRVQSFSPIREKETAFGGKCKEKEEFTLLFRELIRLGAGFSVADFFPSVKLLQYLTGLRPKLERMHRKVDKILQNVINEHKCSNGLEKSSETESDDLLDVLLIHQKHGDLEFPLTTENIKSVILDIFSGGSETSSTLVEWAMLEMMKNPRVMREAQAEVRQVFEGKGIPDETGIHELKYLKSVIKETLRLHPIFPLLLPRECSKDCEVNGFQIPSKTRVIINAWAIGRDPNHWPEPEKFYPERFLNSSVDFMGTNFEFIPFGAGRRICPGILFALPNVELPLAQLLFHFDWKLPNGMKQEDVDMAEVFGVTVRSKNELVLVPTPYHASTFA
ncbi:hypothetical protein REPUB_Repub05bG0009800 [Reevesia pubescens]